MLQNQYLTNAVGDSIQIGLTQEFDVSVNVRDEAFGAVGDGIKNDRAAIQKAIDFVYTANGGRVILPGGRTYLTGDLELKSNVTLEICSGAVLMQSKDSEDYARKPEIGVVFPTSIPWDEKYYFNYPLIFAGGGTSNVRITGGGVIELYRCNAAEDDKTIFLSAIGFFEVKDFEISDLHVKHSHGHTIAFRKCNNGLVKGVTISDSQRGSPNGWSTDGISMNNCQNMRVTECNIASSDDLIYVWTSYKDPRGKTWWNSENPQPTTNIEVDHNICTMIDRKAGDWCHGFGMLTWGGSCPDLSRIEISNIFVHDNVLSAPHPIGTLDTDAFYATENHPPARDIKFEKNTLIAPEGWRAVWLDKLPITNLMTDFSEKDLSGISDWLDDQMNVSLIKCQQRNRNAFLYQKTYVNQGGNYLAGSPQSPSPQEKNE